VNGRAYALGELRDWSWHGTLRRSFVMQNGVHPSWVGLRAGQRLVDHRHPMDSMIVITKGSVFLTGASVSLCVAGDVVQVPAGVLHGFRCGVGQSFEGLSIQPGDTGIYSDASRPAVTFSQTPAEARIAELEADAARQLEDFRSHAALVFLRSKREWDPTVERFFAAFSVWSRQFQQLVALRRKLDRGTPLEPLADWHYAEELGHDSLLRLPTTGVRPECRAALREWNRRLTTIFRVATPLERAAAMHTAIETSATHFYGALGALGTSPALRLHVAPHAHDDVHADAVAPYLRHASAEELVGVWEVVNATWDQLQTLFDIMIREALFPANGGDA
jgi:quercetin dioxygenase-like cupin family protein